MFLPLHHHGGNLFKLDCHVKTCHSLHRALFVQVGNTLHWNLGSFVVLLFKCKVGINDKRLNLNEPHALKECFDWKQSCRNLAHLRANCVPIVLIFNANLTTACGNILVEICSKVGNSFVCNK